MFHIAQYFPITDPTLIFFVVLLIILFAPIIMGKLRIPHIIGMVLAGVLIGKYGLNILERDSSFELFGKVGLYYIMFLAALEMDMEGMKKNKSRLLIYGLLTCFIPFFLTYGMSIWLLHCSTRYKSLRHPPRKFVRCSSGNQPESFAYRSKFPDLPSCVAGYSFFDSPELYRFLSVHSTTLCSHMGGIFFHRIDRIHQFTPCFAIKQEIGRAHV